MNKVIAAGAVGMLCAGSALAQSSVVVYGVLDTYMAYTDADGKGRMRSVDSGGYQASRVGFRGVEDLGGGLRASFQLENGFGSDTGAMHDGTRLFNRQAWVGVGGGFGELRFGRQNSPKFLMIARLDPYGGATFASFLNNVSAYTPRYDNVIGYLSPALGPVKLQAYYSLGERSETSRGLSTTMLAGEYEQGPLYLGISSSRQNSANHSVAIQSTFAGGSYDYGQGRVYLGAYRGNNLGASAVNNIAGSYYTALSLSATWRVGGGTTLGAGYGQARDGTGTGSDARQLSLVGMVDLSKRTMLYATYARLLNDAGASFALSAAAPITKNVPVPGGAVDGLQFGIRHLF